MRFLKKPYNPDYASEKHENTIVVHNNAYGITGSRMMIVYDFNGMTDYFPVTKRNDNEAVKIIEDIYDLVEESFKKKKKYEDEKKKEPKTEQDMISIDSVIRLIGATKMSKTEYKDLK